MSEAAAQELSYNGRAVEWRDLRELGTNDGRFIAGLVAQHIRASMTSAMVGQCWAIGEDLVQQQEKRLQQVGCTGRQVRAYGRAARGTIGRVRKALEG